MSDPLQSCSDLMGVAMFGAHAVGTPRYIKPSADSSDSG